MIYILDNGEDYSDHEMCFVVTVLPPELMKKVIGACRWTLLGWTTEITIYEPADNPYPLLQISPLEEWINTRGIYRSKYKTATELFDAVLGF